MLSLHEEEFLLSSSPNHRCIWGRLGIDSTTCRISRSEWAFSPRETTLLRRDIMPHQKSSLSRSIICTMRIDYMRALMGGTHERNT